MPGTFAYDAGTNTVTVTGGTSGSPADFASFVAADRAGAGTSLLAAWAPNSNTKALTYQVRPVELLALLISFVVASKTAETDYIFITGTDAWGAAQTESLDVSAGNGTYVSTKRWRTITNIDCSDNPAGGGTVWANGTVAVTQPIWGVIWNKGNGQYQLDCLFNVGDGSTLTYFKETNKQITYLAGLTGMLLEVYPNATLALGDLLNEATHQTSKGCHIIVNPSGWAYFRFRNGCVAYLNSCIISQLTGQLRILSYQSNLLGGRFWNCQTYGPSFYGVSPGVDFHNLIIAQNNDINFAIAASMSDVKVFGGTYGFSLEGSGATNGYDLFLVGQSYTFNINTLTASNYICDSFSDAWSFAHQGTITGALYRQYTLNLLLTDITGNPISGAAVVLKDNSGDTIVSTTTAADGTITFSGQSSSPYSNAITHTRYYGNSMAADYRGPFTLTITADGYQDYQEVITIDRKMDLEMAMLGEAAGGGVFPTNLGLVPLGIKQVAV